jgi:hypothetical protein
MHDPRRGRTELSIARWTESEWHKLWLMLRTRPWLTLALVPGASDVSGELTLGAAVQLSRTGATHLRSPIHVADATTISLQSLATLTQELELCKQSGAPVLIALPSVTENPAALSIARQAETVLLCAICEQTNLGDIKATIAEVGQNRFVGSVMFHGDALEK